MTSSIAYLGQALCLLACLLTLFPAFFANLIPASINAGVTDYVAAHLLALVVIGGIAHQLLTRIEDGHRRAP